MYNVKVIPLVHEMELTRVVTSGSFLVVAVSILLKTLGVGALIKWMGLFFIITGKARSLAKITNEW